MAAMKFNLRRAAIKALVSAQFPWTELDDITVYDHHTGWEDPHFKVEFIDDGVQRTLYIKIKIEEY
jgi:hypothetical protein